MQPSDLPQRLSQIVTRWSLVFQAHQDQADAATVAQNVLMQRYCRAIYRYLLGAVRDANVADDLSQDFALRLVRGDFKRADPGRGRFRDFVKTCLYHMVIDYQRGKKLGQADSGIVTNIEGREDTPDEIMEKEFLASWREELLTRSWEGLAALEQETGQPFYTMLRFRADNPKVRSAEMAEQLQTRLGKPLTDVAVRKTLQRARDKFADLLLEEVARSLQTSDVAEIERELIDLNLLSYCQDALKQFGHKG
jgi:RNA polymerase sigma-70 factor (ECF subfamily)